MKKYKYSLKEQQAYAAEIARRSHGLWRSVNACIAEMLRNKGKRSRKHIAKQLMAVAGPYSPSAPVATSNFRAAARQVLSGESMTLL